MNRATTTGWARILSSASTTVVTSRWPRAHGSPRQGQGRVQTVLGDSGAGQGDWGASGARCVCVDGRSRTRMSVQ